MKSFARLRSCIARRILFGDRLPVVMQTLSTPCATIASASLSLAVQMPMAPAAICSFAIAAHLCVLACGRLSSLLRRNAACIFAMLASSLSRSTHKRGVSRSHLEMPVPIGVTGLAASTSAVV